MTDPVDDEDQQITFHDTEDGAFQARRDFMNRFGNAVCFTMISRPNDKRPEHQDKWMFEGVYNPSRVRKPLSRRIEELRW